MARLAIDPGRHRVYDVRCMRTGSKATWLVCLAVLLLSGFGSAAAATPGRTLDRAPIPAVWRATLPEPLEQSLLARDSARPASVGRISRGSWWGGPVVASTGETVTIYISDSFPQDEATRQTWANFFAWLYHGSELSSVTIYQATLDEVQSICGTGAAGCYSPVRRILVFPGDVGAGADADVGAHEYGHHIAANRRNDPWDAADWGTKRWASTVGVCTRVTAGTAFPGDEGDHYELNSGEAFAESNRFLNQQRGGTWAYLPLIVDASFTPTSASMAATLADIQQPWTGPTPSTWDGQFVAPVVPLTATVGPRSTISLTTSSGARVRSLAAGTYAITVRDRSTKDNFHLSGSAGLNRRTGVAGRGRVVWTLALKPGIHRYRSDADRSLAGSFTVKAAGPIAFPAQDRTFTTLLDGSLQATVSGSAGATLDLLDPASGQALVGATPGSVSSTLCGLRSVLLRVAATRPGTFHVSVDVP
jgi:hypothetical protein